MSEKISSDVQALAHFLAGLEIRNALGRDIDRVARAGIAALAGVAVARGEGAKAPQFDAAAILQLIDDRIEEGAHHQLDIPDGETGMVFAQFLDKFGTERTSVG